MWFWLSLIALLCWSGSDLFSKIGCRDSSDKYSHLKMVIAVGTVMGLHAAFKIFVGGTEINWSVIWTYMPVSLLYIGSMTLGYLGLRYIELSVSSPICNSSGALVAVLTLLIIGPEGYTPLAFFAIGLVCVGAVGLGVVDAVEDPELRAERQAAGNYKYAKSFLALALPSEPLPIIVCSRHLMRTAPTVPMSSPSSAQLYSALSMLYLSKRISSYLKWRVLNTLALFVRLPDSSHTYMLYPILLTLPCQHLS